MKSKLLYERALMTCVLMLLVSVILKLFGVPWFNLDTSIPILNKIDKVIGSDYILKTLYNLVFYSINAFMFMSIVFKKRTIVLPYVFVFLSIMYVKDEGYSWSLLYEQGLLFALILITNKELSIKQCVIRYIYVNVVMCVFQCISLFLRGSSVNIGQYGIIESTLLMIDYYILLFIFYEAERRQTKWISLVSGSSLVAKLWKKPTQNSNQCSSKEM